MGKFKVVNRALVTCIQETRGYLGEENFNKMLNEYQFIKYLSDLVNFPIRGPTLTWLAGRGKVETNNNPNKRTLKFNINGDSYTFGPLEFTLITGLQFGEYPNFDEETETSFWTFLGTRNLRFEDLVAKLNIEGVNNPDSIETRKLAVLFILHSMVFVKGEKNVIHPRAICLADDPELFNSYPWGRMVYEYLVQEWAHMFKRINDGTSFIHLRAGTFPFAIQGWVLESLLPEFSSTLARRLPGNSFPRIFRWDTSKELEGGYTLARQTIYEAEDVCINLPFLRVTPEAEELEKDYYKSVRAYIDYKPAQAYPMFPTSGNDDENVPGFLNFNMGLKKLDRKIDTGVERLSMLEERVACAEGNKTDVKLIELKVAKRVQNMFSYKFDVLKYTIEKEVISALNLQPPEAEAPKVFDVAGDVFIDAEFGDDTFEEAPVLSEDQTTDGQVSEDTNDHFIVGGRPVRLKRPAPTTISPYVVFAKKYRKKKANKSDVEKENVQPDISIDLMFDLPLPIPLEPSKEHVYNTIMYSILRTWLSKNVAKSKVAGLVPVVSIFEAISCYDLELLISERGWLSGEVIDAHLQLLNMQSEEYPSMFQSTDWTCLGALHNKSVRYGYKLFVQNRKMYADKGLKVDVSWESMDIDLCKSVAGIFENWKSRPWISCDRVYGIENIAGSHWAAYEYDFSNKEIRVYDSMSTSYKKERIEVFDMHAALAPSLYNEVAKDKIEPDTPFVINVVDVAQQPNGYDCGVYSIKSVQCLAMKSSVHDLVASAFVNFRRKLAVDIVKWNKTLAGKYSFVEKEIKV